MMPAQATGDGVRLRVRLTPKAAANRIDGIRAGADGAPVLKASVTAVPEGGKANAALLKMLAKTFGLPKTSLSITSGATDRNKTLLIAGDPARLMDRLSAWTGPGHG